MYRIAKGGLFEPDSSRKRRFQAESAIVVKGGVVLVAPETCRVEIRQPGRQYRRGKSRGLHLP
jgi:hypothetical protein